MAKKNKIFGVDFIYETVELNKTFIVEEDYDLYKKGKKLEILKVVYIREFNPNGTSFVHLDTIYFADGEVDYMGREVDYLLEFFHYVKPYKEPNSINFIKEG